MSHKKPSWILSSLEKNAYLKVSLVFSIASFMSMTFMNNKDGCLNTLAKLLSYVVYIVCCIFFFYELIVTVTEA